MDLRSYFHHPDLSLPVIRRRAAEAFVDLLACHVQMSTTWGRAVMWENSFPSREAYYNAVRRLRKAGFIAYRRSEDNEPVLIVTEEGKKRLPPGLNPQRFWKKKWRGIWYLLAYDVEEKNRAFRDGLRSFLERMRMGCLQRSVWVSARDVRPEYDDLIQSLNVESVSFLFESRTVLGRRTQDVVESAWDFERLRQIQSWYGEVFEHNLARVYSGNLSESTVRSLAREEVSGYLSAMAEDPLLPAELHPAGYLGPKVYNLHERFVYEVGQALRRARKAPKRRRLTNI